MEGFLGAPPVLQTHVIKQKNTRMLMLTHGHTRVTRTATNTSKRILQATTTNLSLGPIYGCSIAPRGHLFAAPKEQKPQARGELTH
jgi:hypothetical protein